MSSPAVAKEPLRMNAKPVPEQPMFELPPVTTNALFAAVREGNAKGVESLLQRGGNPNTTEDPSEKYSDGSALLHEAANGRLAVAEVLLAAGADPNIRNKKGFTPLHYAVQEKVNVTVTVSSTSTVRAEPLSATAQTERQKLVELLITKGADANAKTEKGTTPLMEAVGSGHMVRLLVKNGANVNAVNDEGDTALHSAMEMHTMMTQMGGDTSAPLRGIEALIGCGADVNPRNKAGETPLDAARPVAPGLIGPLPGSVEDLPSVKHLRSKGGKKSSEL